MHALVINTHFSALSINVDIETYSRHLSSYKALQSFQWSYRDDLTLIDGVIMKGRCIIIPVELK